MLTQTIDGPGGVLKKYENWRPDIAEIIPTKAVIITIVSGLLDVFLAAAAGIIKSADINNRPTTFIETATVTAKAMVSINFSFFGLIPLEYASSSFKVETNFGDHRQ